MDNKFADEKSSEIEETLENKVFIEQKTDKVQNDNASVDVSKNNLADADEVDISNALIEINSNQIKNLIYTIRGEKVMLDSDLAKLYQVQTKVLNQAVKRNIKRFPDEFMFRLTNDDIALVRSQNVTSPENKLFKGQEGGRRYLPYCFTEQGIAMLSAILKSDVAIEVSIKIMKAFVEMRNFLIDNRDMFSRLNSLELNQLKHQLNTETRLDKFELKQSENSKKLVKVGEKIEQVFDYIAENKEVKQKIFFDGQIYDAFSLLTSIVKKANKSIILIDNYVDTVTLDILSKRKEGVNINIYTSKKSKLTDTEIDKFNKQYGSLIRSYIETFHDRFMILDESICYHIGASIKDAGNKSFATSKIEDKQNIKDILKRLQN